jgi:hypothetical protein
MRATHPFGIVCERVECEGHAVVELTAEGEISSDRVAKRGGGRKTRTARNLAGRSTHLPSTPAARVRMRRRASLTLDESLPEDLDLSREGVLAGRQTATAASEERPQERLQFRRAP